MMSPLILDSVTMFPADTRGRAAIAASHGGVYAAYLAAEAGIKAVILCDAGIGRMRAGIAGVDSFDRLEVPAATVGHRSARIGDGADCYARGILSHVNKAGYKAGARVGMSTREALQRFDALDLPPSPAPPAIPGEHRQRITDAEIAGVNVVVLDSAGLVTPQDAGHIVLTGSHGALLGGRPETAIKYDVFAAFYNDAGFGADDAGISRLPALQARGIAGLAVSAWSACIGDGLSTYRDGYVAAINAAAKDCGVQIGMPASVAVGWLAQARRRQLEKKI